MFCFWSMLNDSLAQYALNKNQKNQSVHAIIEIIKKWLANDDRQNAIMNDRSEIWTDYEVACVLKKEKKEEKDVLEKQHVERNFRLNGLFSAIIYSTEGEISFDVWFVICKRFLFFDVFQNWLKRNEVFIKFSLLHHYFLSLLTC